jgi:hypothetical protein
MRYLRTFLLLLAVATLFALSCKKWKDAAPRDDPRISTPYCNDPEAVNYNWGFPGKPDNSVCYYAADIFAGTYTVHDTAYKADLYVWADSTQITISRITNSKISVTGLCSGGGIMYVTARTAYQATIDTTVGDSLSLDQGQLYCRPQDTVSGYFNRDKFDSSLMYINLTVKTDTGTTVHLARAVKKI